MATVNERLQSASIGHAVDLQHLSNAEVRKIIALLNSVDADLRKLLIDAIEKAGTTDPAKVQDALIGVSVPNLTGGYAAMMPNHHITKPVLIGEIQDDGQFEVVSETPGTVVGDEWSDYLPGSKDLISDWRKPLACGNFNVKTGKCGGSTK